MHKLSLIGLAVAALSLSALTTTPTFAMGCLNPYAGVVDLTHNAMQTGAGFGYDKEFVDKQLASGNRCDVNVEQSVKYGSAYNQYNRRSEHNTSTGSNGNFN